MNQIYVEFVLEHGRFLPEYSTEKVDAPDPAAIEPPDRCYAFQFYERTELEQDGEVLTGKRRDIGPLYYIGGKVETLADVEKRNNPDEDILRSNMRINEFDVIHTRYGRALPFYHDKSKILAEPPQ